jgi:hypothetical protein
VEYLGHIISTEGVATDTAKIVDIIQWKEPHNIKKLLGFLDLTDYYRRFIKDYATIFQPLYLALKNEAFQWGSSQQAAFQQLKLAMTTPPLLSLPNFQKPFVLETDACATGLGAVLMQDGKPLTFFSKGLGPVNSALSIYEKEALAMLQALKKWRHYFLGNKLVIKTDQKSLKYLGSQRLIEGIQHKLMLKLLEFDYTIEYKKGSENIAADALSRQFQTNYVDSYQLISKAIPSWATKIAESYNNDAHCTKLLQELAINTNSHPHFSLNSGILRYKGRIYIGTATELK